MACPTCDHTMQAMYDSQFHKQVWWCPRCGTIRVHWSGNTEADDDIHVPRVSEVLVSAGRLGKSITLTYLPGSGLPWTAESAGGRKCLAETPINGLSGLLPISEKTVRL